MPTVAGRRLWGPASLTAAEDEGKTLRKRYCLNVSKSETINVINIYFIYIYEFHRLKKFPNQFN